MYPLPGVDLNSAVDILRDLARLAGNMEGAASTPGIEGVRQRQSNYLEWVDLAEPRLIGLYGPTALERLHTDSYWQIGTMDLSGPRPFAMINNEVARQKERLTNLANQLETRARRFDGTAGAFVADTNVFLHYHTLNEPERWRDEALHRECTVVVPLRVVQELDAKKRSPNKRMGKRARDRLRRMSAALAGGLDGEIVDGVTLRVVHEPDLFEPEADEEILNVAERVQLYTSQPVTVLTGDTSMQLRARARGLRSDTMPDSLELTSDSDGESSSE